MADIDDLIRDLNKIQENSEKAMKNTIMKILSDANEIVVDKTPVGDTGDLHKDWNIEVDGKKGMLFNDMEYAPHVEFGHRVRGGGGGGKKRRKGNKKKKVREKGRKDGKAKGSPVEGVYMLRDTMNQIKSNMDYYGEYYIKELGLEND
ncbi:HK97 gp10 family phage protein [Peptacetobacter hiranonis]|uniref:HK97 gp10 family phage protein n=1 Tax=Peptacetobacter hiranonis (strain DSM 13275 / JCM 10541 / KCTC 15199 / TO-931) TaxID=500633 RepID=B6G000_PEPHT|nr:HK97 gp10 family phage protein [Peptacetobacter hiranonis]EEA84828.1 hypothetical protein CLOHIR_01454 [Peptacetobacter hiranonis DSM 13275]QEK20765.1 hypothetical protein KGNDJEFE_01252 [Peptacetobacter hiranonis]